MTTNKQVAVTILQQLGGNKFLAMTGAKNLACDNNSMVMSLPKGVKMKITLDVTDTYTMETFKIRNYDIKPIAKHEGLYCDMLQSTFTEMTGLYTRL